MDFEEMKTLPDVWQKGLIKGMDRKIDLLKASGSYAKVLDDDEIKFYEWYKINEDI